jgi:prolipoprotein diacylglyceryltransferase
MLNRVNSFLDALPKGQVLTAASAVPAYRACGIAGFHAALILTAAAGLITGRSLLLLAVVAAVCAASFFAYTYLRKWITGFECLVLIEHVWFALAASAAALWLTGQPVLIYLDAAAPGICVFLAAGRLGCLIAGCCHGCPSSLGIRYPRTMTAEGFPNHWVGVRLFPVQAIEAGALLFIAFSAFATLPWAAPGRPLAWFLLSYAIVRFGLEALRGDRRPHWLGLSQPRWMCLMEIVAVIAWQSGAMASAFGAIAFAGGAAFLILALFVRQRKSLRGTLLRSEHLSEIRALASNLRPSLEPAVAATSQRATVALSERGHVSLSLPGLRRDLQLLCELAAAAFPELRPGSAQYYNGVLHFHIEQPLSAAQAPGRNADRLWAQAAARMQQDPAPPPVPEAVPSPPAASPPKKHWYLRAGASL